MEFCCIVTLTHSGHVKIEGKLHHRFSFLCRSFIKVQTNQVNVLPRNDQCVVMTGNESLKTKQSDPGIVI